jgi:hypothetical protein
VTSPTKKASNIKKQSFKEPHKNPKASSFVPKTTDRRDQFSPMHHLDHKNPHNFSTHSSQDPHFIPPKSAKNKDNPGKFFP